MQLHNEAAARPQPSTALLWTGRVLSALPVLGLTFSAILKLMKPAAIVEEFSRLGYPENLILGIGILELVCTALYVIPRTSVIGAILITAYLGGATATHVRIDDSSFPPVIMGVLVWLGLYLRDMRIRSVVESGI